MRVRSRGRAAPRTNRGTGAGAKRVVNGATGRWAVAPAPPRHTPSSDPHPPRRADLLRTTPFTFSGTIEYCLYVARGRHPGPQRRPTKYILTEVLKSGSCLERDLLPGFEWKAGTLTKTVTGLIAEGWLQAAPGARAKAYRVLSLGPRAGYVVGIGVGRELLRCAIYAPNGDQLVGAAERCLIFPIGQDAITPHRFRDLVSAILLRCRAKLDRPINIAGGAVAWPARISGTTGLPEPLECHKGWDTVDVRELVGDALERSGFPRGVAIVNDANAEALAESRRGTAVNATTALVVKIAGGVGAGVVHEGELMIGGHGFAGELGHIPVGFSAIDPRLKIAIEAPADVKPLDPDAQCDCGRPGHLQALISVTAVIDRLRPGLAEELGSYLLAADAINEELGLDPATGEWRRSPVVDQVMHQMGALLGRALCGPVGILDPDVVILRSLFFPSPRLVHGVQEELSKAMLERPEVRLGTLGKPGRWMGAQGAALFAADRYVAPRVDAKCEQEPLTDPPLVSPLDVPGGQDAATAIIQR